jgi:thiol-disulfide isomerase/thioredoxin
MNLNKTTLIALLWLTAGRGFAQTTALKPLSIGDKLPDMVLSPVINYKQPTFNTGDYSHQLLILDFWATWCHWCIAAFPKEDSLSVKYSDRLQFLLVDYKTDDKIASVISFYKKRLSTYPGFKLPSVYSDTVLFNLFPHRLMPHYVWIRNGTIMAITDAGQVNDANIEQVLSGAAITLPLKKL